MEPGNVDPLVARDELRLALSGLMRIESTTVRQDRTIVVEGELIGDERAVYRPIRQRAEAVGYTPFLQPVDGGVRLIAIPGVVARRQPRTWINLALFLLTVVTVVWTGALNELNRPIDTIADLVRPLLIPSELILGLPFAATLLGILGAHEMGHFVVGRLRGAPVSWPYFIPVPPGISITGTMGAVIVQREPLEDRRTLLEVGIAGPLAGLAVAIPLLLIGLSGSTVHTAQPPYMQEGNSLLYAAAKWLVFGQFLPSNGLDVQINSVAFGAWIGLLVTMFNLLPVGQLDGGHISYALLGRRSHYVAYAVIGLCLAMGLLFSYTWLFWAVLATLTGMRHPPPFNDVPELGPGHTALAIAGLVLFFLLLMPAPLTIVTP